MDMKFYILHNINFLKDPSNVDGFYLIPNNWDDWFKYETSFSLWIKKNNIEHFIGTTKIGSFSMKQSQRRPEIPEFFSVLPTDFFSLGSDEAFYIELNRGPVSEYREIILNGLRDVSFDDEIYNNAKRTDVFKVSLTRGIMSNTITGRFRRLSNGNIRLSNYHFEYRLENGDSSLEFKVNRDTLPPSNIHTIIGRNGVGKSHVLNTMVKSIIEKSSDFSFNTEHEDNFFSNIISVNYSTFERKELLPENKDISKGYLYYHLSSKSKARTDYKFFNEQGKEISVTGMEALFIESIISCFNKKPKRWKDCIEVLYSDPLFKSLDVTNLYNNYVYNYDENNFLRNAYNLFDKLSSGHKIVLLTLTKLVEVSEDKTLIIMDEPEMHLHPPLLGSFIRSLSDLLNTINGVSILATHSPIILQETQAECVYKLSRERNTQIAERPTIETFGEDIGILTSEIFGLEVTDSGFHQLIKKIVAENLSFEDSCKKFEGHLGSEAYSILLTQINLRDKGTLNKVRVDE